MEETNPMTKPKAARKRPLVNYGFPQRIFATPDPHSPEVDLLAYRTMDQAVEGDGPTLVGRYELVDVRKLAKEVIEVPRKP
jgi:hypothetical protein